MRDASIDRPRLARSGAMIGLCLAACTAVSSSRGQPILYEASFDVDADGWTVQEYQGFCPLGAFVRDVLDISRQPRDGTPYGFLRAVDPAVGSGASFKAPAGLIAALPASNGGYLTFDRRVVYLTGDPFTNTQDEVTIIGNGLTLIATTPFPPLDTWASRVVPMVPSAWRVGTCSGPLATQTEFNLALSTATALFIKAEGVNGNELDDLDSVRLLGPVPGDSQICGEGWKWIDNNEPTARWGHTVAVDTSRNVLVLYGGFTGETDTWEYPLGAGVPRVWRRTATSGPGPKAFHAMAYDAARQRVVLTGGRYAPILTYPEHEPSADVWEYQSDGITGSWTLSPEKLPQARAGGHRMVYDDTRQTLVIYGGLAAGATGAVDVLERGPGSAVWQTRSSTTNPGAQSGHAMAYDAFRQRTVLMTTGGTSVRLWEWDGSVEPGVWTQVTATAAPGNRNNMAAVYHPTRRTIIMTGGGTSTTTDGPGTFEYNPQTLAWTGRANIQVSGANSSRSFHAMAFDATRDRVLLLSGLTATSDPRRDMLSFDPNTNTWFTDRNLPNSPPPRVLAPTAFDEAGGRVVMAGGGLAQRGNRTQLIGSDTFIFDGTTWTAPAADAPATVWKAPLVYVPERSEMYLYAGETTNSLTVSAQVWRLSLTSAPTWSVRTTSAPGGPRANHAGTYDRVRQRIVFFGGRDAAGVFLNDTWLLDPATDAWTQVVTPIAPPPRNGSAMVFDQRRGVTVLFGGLLAPGVYDASTWEFDGATWRDVTPAYGNPPGRSTHSLVYAPDRGTVILTGGEGSNETGSAGLDDVWEFDGTAWRRLLPASSEAIVGKAYAAHAYDTVRNKLVRFGGGAIMFPPSGNQYYWFLSGQTWTLDLPNTPVLRSHPVNPPLCAAAPVTLSVTAVAEPGLTYRWRVNGVPISLSSNPSAGTPLLSISAVNATTAGAYDCLVTNQCGSTISLAAILEYCPADHNCSGAVGVDDVFDFLNSWFAGLPSADFDGVNGIQPADIFGFLNAWFFGCP